jgi:hypothetical protein
MICSQGCGKITVFPGAGERLQFFLALPRLTPLRDIDLMSMFQADYVAVAQ